MASTSFDIFYAANSLIGQGSIDCPASPSRVRAHARDYAQVLWNAITRADMDHVRLEDAFAALTTWREKEPEFVRCVYKIIHHAVHFSSFLEERVPNMKMNDREFLLRWMLGVYELASC